MLTLLRSHLGQAMFRGFQKREIRRHNHQIPVAELLEQRLVLNAVTSFEFFNNIDWTSAGVGGISRFEPGVTNPTPQETGSGQIEITGISGTVEQAWLVWHGIDQTNLGGDGIYDNETILFEGQSVTGFSRGVNDTAGWGAGGSQTFLADVRSLVTGNGIFQLDNLSAKAGHSANGASLIVIYDDGDDTNNRDLNLFFGNQNRTEILQASGIQYNGGDVQAQLIVADGQALLEDATGRRYYDSQLIFTTFNGESQAVIIDDSPTLLDGNSVASAGNSRAATGDLWDMHTFDVTNAVSSFNSAGNVFELEMQLGPNSADSLKWIGLLVDQPTAGTTTGNSRPVAENLAFETNEMTGFTGQLVGTDTNNDALTYRIIDFPESGFIQYSSISGRFSYYPNDGFSGTDTFTYVVNDGQIDSAIATVTINIIDVNSPPQVPVQHFDGTEDFVLIGQIAALDPEGDPLTFTTSTPVEFGQLILSPDGYFEYTPDENFAGTDQITVQVSDGNSVVEQSIYFQIAPVNDAPVGEMVVFETPEDNLLNGAVVATDVDANDILTYQLVDDVYAGSLTFRSDGTFSYRPNSNFTGADFFTYQASDGTASSEVITVGIDVLPVNDRPSAANNFFYLNEDRNITDQVVGTDVDGDVLTFSLTDGPEHGVLVFNNDGTFTYTPEANYNGFDEFRYSVFDGELYGYSEGTARLSIAAVDDAPNANDDSFTVPEDGSLSLSVPVTNFSFVSESGEYVGGGQTLDYDLDNASFSVLRSQTNSYIGINVRSFTNSSDYWRLDFAAPAGEILELGTYTGATRYPFQDAEDPGFTVSGQHRGYNTSVGEFTITQLNTAEDGSIENFAATFWYASYATAPRMTGAINYNLIDGSEIGSVLTNDTDADGDQLSAFLVDGPEHGTLVFRSDGSFDYAPDANFSGTDTFTYRATDGVYESGLGFVTLNVTPSNDTPTSTNSELITDEDVSGSGQLTSEDIDGDELTFSMIGGPSNGTLDLNPDGSYIYTPNENYFGSDSFSFVANDGSVDSNIATVQISVNSINDIPTATTGIGILPEDSLVNGQLTGTDADGDPLTFNVVDGPTHGTLDLTSDGYYTYTPDANFNGSDSFTYVTNDGTANSDPALIMLRVNAVNDAPTANDSTNSLDEDNNLFGTVNGSDVDGDAISFELVEGPAHGTVQFTQNGNYNYTPEANYYGPDSFTFRATDGTLVSSPATVNLMVNSVNDVPTADPQSLTTDEDNALTGQLSGSDVDGDVLSYLLNEGPQHGSLILNGDGSFTYTPDENYFGTDSFSFISNDNLTDSAAATVSIQINSVNDAPVINAAGFSLDENSSAGTSVGFVTGSDVDDASLTYAITTGNDSGAFSINSDTGEITVADSTKIDFETNPVFNLEIQVTDPDGASATAAIVISLNDVSETLTANIDFDPNDDQNEIRLRKTKSVKVALLSSSGFDLSDVDLTSLQLTIDGQPFDLKTKGRHQTPKITYSDLDGDGIDDLVLEFEFSKNGLSSGTAEVELTGSLFDGREFTATSQANLR